MTKCILSKFRKDGCASCSRFCGHKIALQGYDGISGIVANANIPIAYRGITLDNSPAREGQGRIYEILERYVSTFDKSEVKSLYLWSVSPGTGKTTTATALLSEWIARQYLSELKGGKQPKQFSGYFLDVNELQTKYNIATMTNDDKAIASIGRTIKTAQEAPFAVIDDIGVRSVTEAFRAYIHSVINYRVTNGLPTVFTSNLPIEEMAEVFDARLYDRIRDMCGVIEFSGESRRGMR